MRRVTFRRRGFSGRSRSPSVQAQGASFSGETVALFPFAETIGVSGCALSLCQLSVMRSLPAGVSTMALLCMDVLGDFWQRQDCEGSQRGRGRCLGDVFAPSLLLFSLLHWTLPSPPRYFRRYGADVLLYLLSGIYIYMYVFMWPFIYKSSLQQLTLTVRECCVAQTAD